MKVADHVAVPVVCVSARDDPVCPESLIPYERITAEGHGAIVVTPYGSHCRFLRWECLFIPIHSFSVHTL